MTEGTAARKAPRDILHDDLERETVRAWLIDAHRTALGDPASDAPIAAVCVGRLMRSGDCSRAARAGLGEWWRAEEGRDGVIDAVAADAERKVVAVRARLAGFEAPGGHGASWAGDSIRERDDVESALVAIGHAALLEIPRAIDAERRLLDAVREVDEAGEALEYEIGAAIDRTLRDPWLSRIASVDDGAWWLQLYIAHELRQDPRVARALASLRTASPKLSPSVLRIAKKAVPRAAAMMMGTNEAGGIDALLERPLGAPAARLFGGDVEVFAIAGDDGDTVVGLLVRDRAGDLARLESVELSPAGPAAPWRSKVDLAWWVPLAGTADRGRALVVRYRREGSDEGKAESLELELF